MLSQLIEALAEPALVVDRRGAIIHANVEMEKLFGYPREELIGSPVERLIPETLREAHRTDRKRYMENPIPRTIASGLKCTGKRKDGSEIPLTISLSKHKDSDQPVVIALMHDFTEPKQSETKYQMLVENMDEILVRVETANGRDEVIFIGPQLRKVLGYEPSEFKDNPARWFQLVHPDDLPAMLQSREETLASGKSSLDRFRIRHKNGQYVWLEAKLGPARDKGGQIVGLQILLSDITDRHNAEEARRISEDRYQSLFENVNDMVFTTDLEGRFTSINPVVQQILGYAPEELVGSDAFALFEEADRQVAHEMLRSKICGEKPWTCYAATMLAKDGHPVHLDLNSRLRCRDGKPVEVAGIARDVSQRRLLEQQLQQAQKMESVGLLAGGVAHDFNNLLTIILGHSQLVIDSLASGDRNRAHVEAIQKASERAANITRQLLAFSRKSVIQPEPLDLTAVIRNIMPMIQRLVGEDFTLVTKLAHDLDPTKADPTQIEQVIMNLVVNARDAMPEGGTITVKTENVRISPESQTLDVPAGDYILLSLSDTGTGMDEETRKHVFEPFFTTKEVGKGTGLGLATVYGIVKQGSGYIELFTAPGKGTEFRIYMPAVQSRTQKGKGPVGAEYAFHKRGGLVLLVEDDRDVLALVSQLLRRNGYQVIEARNGNLALQMLKDLDEPVDVLLTDVIMPGITGQELVRQARQIYPELKVVFMSGYTRDAIDRHGATSLDDALIAKPFDERALLEHLPSRVNVGAV